MSRYDELAGDASVATEKANENQTVRNHKAAAGAHLVASEHCKSIGWPDKAELHDRIADEHIAAFKDLQKREAEAT